MIGGETRFRGREDRLNPAVFLTTGSISMTANQAIGLITG